MQQKSERTPPTLATPDGILSRVPDGFYFTVSKGTAVRVIKPLHRHGCFAALRKEGSAERGGIMHPQAWQETGCGTARYHAQPGQGHGHSPSTKEWASRNPLQTLTATTTNTASGTGVGKTSGFGGSRALRPLPGAAPGLGEPLSEPERQLIKPNEPWAWRWFVRGENAPCFPRAARITSSTCLTRVGDSGCLSYGTHCPAARRPWGLKQHRCTCQSKCVHWASCSQTLPLERLC